MTCNLVGGQARFGVELVDEARHDEQQCHDDGLQHDGQPDAPTSELQILEDEKQHLDVTRRSAIDADGLSIDVGGCVGAKEHDRICDFFGGAIPPDRHAFGVVGHDLFL